MLHISMRNVVRLGLIMLVAAIALSAPKAQASDCPFGESCDNAVFPPTPYIYQDNEGAGTLNFSFLNPTSFAVTLEQAGTTLSGAGTREEVSPTQSVVEFRLQQDVGGVLTGPTYVFSGTVFHDALGNNAIGGGTYTLQGAPEFEFQWFFHN